MNETQIELLVSILAVLVVLHTLSLLIKKYHEYLDIKFTYRYYAIRDRLANLVLQGKLDEKSNEYSGLIDVINYHIYSLEKITLTAKLNAILEASDRTLQTANDLSLENEGVRRIVRDLLSNTDAVIRRNSKFEISLLKTFKFLLSASGKTSRITNYAKRPVELSERIEQKIHDIQDHVHA
ncbi:MAG: hypothetical protein AB2745_17235 [Candidatus Thiodiazotropha endolucinida]